MPDNVPLPIANGFYLSDAPVTSAQQCINFYPNIVQAPALSQETVLGTAGIDSITTTGIIAQANRGSIVMNDLVYFVNGETFYRLNRLTVSPATYSFDALGTILGTARCSLATNGTQIVILPKGGVGSLWDGTTFTDNINVIDSDFTANGIPQHVVYIDGYFLFTTDNKKFIISSLNDGLAYNALDFGSAEADPDAIVAPVVYKNQVFIMGVSTIEGFENVGGSGFPFQRNGLLDDTGLLAPFSVINGDDAFRFVGASKNEGPGIYEHRGSGAVKISNTAMDSILQDISDVEISEIFAVHYGLNGQFFTCFTVQGREESFEFNAVGSRWHQRQSYIDSQQDAWRVSSIVTGYGELIAFDRTDGRIGKINEDSYTEYGEPIFRRLDTQPFANNGNSASISSLELTMEPGVGNAAVADPQIRMSKSYDGGKIFSSELSRPIGRVGDYKKRQIWRRLGRVPRYAMFRFEMTDAVKPALIKLEARSRGGTR
jgi:hypothetical protein